MASANHAIVIGASGLVGWGVTEQLLNNYPTKGSFAKVTVLVNRPLTIEQARWPITPGAPSLNLISGTNFTKGSPEEFTETIKTSVPDASTVTHVFYFAFKPNTEDELLEAETNAAMLRRACIAFETLSPSFRHFIFPGGVKIYGMYLGGGIYPTPWREDVDRNAYPATERNKCYYFAVEDFLRERSRGKKWTWSEVHFDAAVGFSPIGSNFNLTAHWGSYLSTFAAVEGQGARVPFPGTLKVYEAFNNEAGTDVIGQLAIWCALNPDKSGGEAFNAADFDEGQNYVDRWPRLARYFGLEGVPPPEGWTPETIPIVSEYIREHKDVMVKKDIKANLIFGEKQLDRYGAWLGYDRTVSMEKARKAGFLEKRDLAESWYKAWQKFREAGMIV